MSIAISKYGLVRGNPWDMDRFGRGSGLGSHTGFDFNSKIPPPQG